MVVSEDKTCGNTTITAKTRVILGKVVPLGATIYYMCVLLAACTWIAVGIAVVNVVVAIGRQVRPDDSWTRRKRHWLATNHGFGAYLLAVATEPLWPLDVVCYEKGAQIPTSGRFLIMSNHLSNMDGILLRGALWPLCPLAVYKSSLHYVPLLGSNLYLTGDFPVWFTKENGGWRTAPGSSQAMFKDMLQALDNHCPVLVFPEGQRNSTPENLLPFRKGMLQFAVENKIPILTVAIQGTQDAWPVHSALMFPARLSVAVDSDLIATDGLSVDQVSSKVRDRMLALGSLC